MSDNLPLRERRCIPCRGDIPPLSSEEIASLASQVSNWQIDSDCAAGKNSLCLRRELRFKNFREAMAFLRELEEIAEAEGHHPDFCVHYNRVRFMLWTHAIAGLHENDFILAAKIDQLYKRYYPI
ncbi:MAG: 4a-hydroxytetrahydrobiopterin dehydratase [Candidatus Zixiibacteriota bacterium]|jgi:4a-hydroxytetrahydrobiopterin dehydratase